MRRAVLYNGVGRRISSFVERTLQFDGDSRCREMGDVGESTGMRRISVFSFERLARGVTTSFVRRGLSPSE